MDVLRIVPPPQESRFDRLLAQARAEYRLLRVLPKRRSLLMRVLYRAALMPLWNPTFLDGTGEEMPAAAEALPGWTADSGILELVGQPDRAKWASGGGIRTSYWLRVN